MLGASTILSGPMLETELKDVSTEGGGVGPDPGKQARAWIDEEKLLLNKGDSYYLKRSSKYRSRNPSETELTIICWIGTYL